MMTMKSDKTLDWFAWLQSVSLKESSSGFWSNKDHEDNWGLMRMILSLSSAASVRGKE